jgi:hypothetical protein
LWRTLPGGPFLGFEVASRQYAREVVCLEKDGIAERWAIREDLRMRR